MSTYHWYIKWVLDNPSIGELFLYIYELRCRDGAKPAIEHMQTTTKEFNNVIGSVFSEYYLQSEWNNNPKIWLVKNKTNVIPLEGLSLGEQEVLSLITNIFASRDKYDTFLIDEPEVHLNWHLEEKLFEYLDRFCDQYSKQMIVVTHSRVIFKEKFLPKTNFLYWNDNGQIEYTTELAIEKRIRLAGDAIEIIKLGDYTKPTFFVEDEAQDIVIRVLARELKVDVSCTICGNKSNVRSLYKSLRDQGEKVYFLEDGDNENPQFPEEKRFIHLSKYCIENYLLDFSICSTITGKNTDEIKQFLLNQIIKNKEKILGKQKYLDFLVDQLKAEDLTDDRLAKFDISLVFQSFLLDIGFDRETFINKYILEANNQGRIRTVFPNQLIEAIQPSAKNE